MEALSELHDAVMHRIELDWISGSFKAVMTPVAEQWEIEEINIIGTDLKEFRYDRSFPWGESVYVNSCQIKTENNESILTIEMQSGDLLVARAIQFKLDM